MPNRIVYLACFLFILIACVSEAQHVSIDFEAKNKRKISSIQAEIASTPSARALGLMYRKKMAETEGMLFIFPDEQIRSFWMKNTYISLDIIYLNANFEIISIVDNATPFSESPLSSNQPAQYVIEINAGLAKKWGLINGTKAKVLSKLPEVIE